MSYNNGLDLFIPNKVANSTNGLMKWCQLSSYCFDPKFSFYRKNDTKVCNKVSQSEKLIYAYHDIMSSRETLLAKLVNISAGVNAMNTTCKMGKQEKKKNLLSGLG